MPDLNIDPDAEIAAGGAIYDAFSRQFGDLNGNDCDNMAEVAIRAYLSDLTPQPDSRQLLALIRDMVDPDPCWFDHHGGCQAHGYLTLKPGEKCPHAEAKEILAEFMSDE